MKPLYAAIILSAGLSSRQKDFKPLLKIGKQTLIDRAVNLFNEGSTDVYVVTGYRRDDIKNYLNNSALFWVDNPNYTRGMFSSIKAGIKGFQKNYEALFILPVDNSLVRHYTIRTLIDKSKNNPGKIVYPVFKGKRGHPPLLPTSLVPEIINSADAGGLRKVLEHFEQNSIEVEVPDRFILLDIDTPADYLTVCRESSSFDIPNQEECQVIFDICEVDISRRLHCLKVAEVASRIGRELIKSNKQVNLDLIQSSAVLHDIAKQQPKHDIAGGRILQEMGFNRVGKIVAVHSFLNEQVLDYILEAKVVYIADKLVLGDKLVSLDERYSYSNRTFKITNELKNIISERKLIAQQVQKELEKLIGRSLQSFLSD
jgi:CTP:molybdopterin cytidylyltransferase MocA